MIKLKNNVNLSGVHSKVYYAASVIAEIYEEYNLDLVITSGRDGRHSKHSVHYGGLAIDCRIYTLPSATAVKEVATEIQKRLGDEFWVLLEKDHIHCQYGHDNIKK